MGSLENILISAHALHILLIVAINSGENLVTRKKLNDFKLY